MQNVDDDALSRRMFLKMSAAGIAVAGSTSLVAHAIGQELSSRKIPSHPIILRSSTLEVVFDPADAVPYEYRLKKSQLRFIGEGSGEPLQAKVHCKEPFGFAAVVAKPIENKVSAKGVDFRFALKYAAEVVAVEFTLRYVVEGNTVWSILEDVKEHDGFELISLSMPSIVTVKEDDEEAWLAHGDAGGDWVALRDAKAGNLRPNTFWGDVNGVLPVIMAGHSGAVCVQETTAFMDGTLLSVAGSAPSRRVLMGTTKVHRVDGSECYDMNLGRDVPKNCGGKLTPNMLVEQKSSVRLDFLEPESNAKLTWLDGAKLVRARMPLIPNHFYDDKFIYGIRTDEPTFPKPSATFEHAEEMIKEMYALTDGWPQLVHLWGWQFRGKDTGYPAVNVVDERIGGYDGMMRLMERGKQWNTTVSLSDNYDDAYRSSPAWNEEMIARKPDGTLWKSRNWTGEDSYIQGLAKYMEGPGVERVRYTCERYRLPGTIHVDVLSYFAIRNDWDPARPASGIRNLYAGRYKILEEFKKHGVDVTSEGLRYPYVGKMSMCWYAGGPSPCPFGGAPIPMLPLIYRKSATWGRATGKGEQPLLLMMFYGEAQHNIFNGNTPIEQRLDTFYLAMVPWFRQHMLNIEGFERNEGKTSTQLEGNGNRVDIDWDKKSYRMVLDGVEVAREGATFCPLGKDRIAMYSITDGVLSASIPIGWNSEEVVAFTLFSDKKESVKLNINNGVITVEATARRPVMIYRNKSIL